MKEMPAASTCRLERAYQRQRSGFTGFKRIVAAVVGSLTIATTLIMPAMAGDPFRSTNPRPIGDRTEAAFKAIFEEGNYIRAKELLETAEADEPLAYAMKASLSYIDGDRDGLGTNATLTREAAERLVQTDPLRGHLYTAVGHFLEGAHILTTQGTVAGTPAVLAKLQQVFDQLNEAERIAPNDPELNLLKGYMDLMLAVNLPFSNPDEAISRLESYAAPEYLAQRGIAIGYRDLRQPERAMQAVDRALAVTPNNPDLLYLKAQILVLQNQNRESLPFFNQALQRQAQLPQSLVNQIAWERCRTTNRIRPSENQRNCNPILRRERQAPLPDDSAEG